MYNDSSGYIIYTNITKKILQSKIGETNILYISYILNTNDRRGSVKHIHFYSEGYAFYGLSKHLNLVTFAPV